MTASQECNDAMSYRILGDGSVNQKLCCLDQCESLWCRTSQWDCGIRTLENTSRSLQAATIKKSMTFWPLDSHDLWLLAILLWTHLMLMAYDLWLMTYDCDVKFREAVPKLWIPIQSNATPCWGLPRTTASLSPVVLTNWSSSGTSLLGRCNSCLFKYHETLGTSVVLLAAKLLVFARSCIQNLEGATWECFQCLPWWQVIRKFTGHDRKVNALAFGPKDICCMIDVLVPRICPENSKRYIVCGDQTITVVMPRASSWSFFGVGKG